MSVARRMTVLRVTVPGQYFCTKHPDLNITAREIKNQAGTDCPCLRRNIHLCYIHNLVILGHWWTCPRGLSVWRSLPSLCGRLSWGKCGTRGCQDTHRFPTCNLCLNMGTVMPARDDSNCENSIFQDSLCQFTTRWSTMLSLGQCPIFWSSRVYSEKLIALMSLLWEFQMYWFSRWMLRRCGQII